VQGDGQLEPKMISSEQIWMYSSFVFWEFCKVKIPMLQVDVSNVWQKNISFIMILLSLIQHRLPDLEIKPYVNKASLVEKYFINESVDMILSS
jgi:hypothetical protein